jgi:hypothetical protein
LIFGFTGLWALCYVFVFSQDGTFEILEFRFSYAFASLLFTTLIWWRGISLSKSRHTPSQLRERIILTICFFTVVGMLNILAKSTMIETLITIGLATLAIALPITHLEQMHLSPVGRSLTNNSSWAWARWVLPNFIMSAVACIIVIFLLNRDLAREIVSIIIAIIFSLFALVLMPVMMPLLELLVRIIRGSGLAMLFQQLEILRTNTNTPTETVQPLFPPVAPFISMTLGILVLVALAGGVLLLTGISRREQDRSKLRNEPYSVPYMLTSTSSMIDQIKRTLNLRRWLSALTVRRLYARMTHEAAKRGTPRLDIQTAYDYVPQLISVFPGCDNEINLLTSAYVAAHYGEVPDSPQALANLQTAWQRMRETRQV